MRPEHAKLVEAIDGFLARTGMSESTFGYKAVNDGKFVARLRDGKRCWPDTAKKAQDFIAANSFTPRRRRSGPTRTPVEQRA